MNDIQSSNLPLNGVRILDLCDRVGQSCGRLLADLGADVFLIEPLGGMISRQQSPLHKGESLRFAVRNANKQSIVIDWQSDEGRAQFAGLVKNADILLDGSGLGWLEGQGFDRQELHKIQPKLVIVSITDFGLVGPYRQYVATDAVHSAMGAFLARSGIEGREPLLPPGEMAVETAAAQAAWVTLLAHWNGLQGAQGDYLDFSINDTVAQILDPGVGVTGSASAGRTAIEVSIHGRPSITYKPGEMPSVALMYPIFRCTDGYVRICVLNPRQWQAMSAWLGPDHPFRAPKYANAAARFMEVKEINAFIADLFAKLTREEILSEARTRGVPAAAVANASDLFGSAHFADRAFFTSLPVGGDQGITPSGYFIVDGKRCGIRTPAPKPGSLSISDAMNRMASRQSASAAAPVSARRPLEGITVLDLGVIVAGAELGRLFADQGARVIKLENAAYADGLRQSFDRNPTPIAFSLGSRGKQSFGLNLRLPEGVALFRKLVEQSDIVISNFKPGTTQSLGIDYETLKAINPRIICAESSAMGSSGREAKTMGYGPLVRASSSLTSLWRYPDLEKGFGDSTTIFPDHFAARVSAVAILAKLIERAHTGVGGFVDVSQAETIMTMLSSEFLRESLQPGSMKAKGNSNEFDAPNGVFPCAGNDEWCVVAVTNDAQWQGLCQAMKRPDLISDERFQNAAARVAHRDWLEKTLISWTTTLTPYQVMEACQAEGVPAGNMLRLSEFIGNPHLKARKFFRYLNQPSVGRPIEAENGPVGLNDTYCPPEIVRAPGRAEHTRSLAKSMLGLSDTDVDALVAAGVLEEGKPATGGAFKQSLISFAIRTGTSAMLKYVGLRHRLGLTK